MKTARTVIGIISMVLFLVIAFQSCAAGILNAMEGEGETSGSSGMALAVLTLIAGIVGVATRSSKGGAITAGAFYAIAGMIGISNTGTYTDLIVWSVLSFAFSAVFLVGAFFQKGRY